MDKGSNHPVSSFISRNLYHNAHTGWQDAGVYRGSAGSSRSSVILVDDDRRARHYPEKIFMPVGCGIHSGDGWMLPDHHVPFHKDP